MPGAPRCSFANKTSSALPCLHPPVGRGGGVKGPASPSSSPTPGWAVRLAGPGHSTHSHTRGPSHWVSEPSLGLGEEGYFGTLNRLPSKRHVCVEQVGGGGKLHSHLPVSSPPQPPQTEQKSWCFWSLLRGGWRRRRAVDGLRLQEKGGPSGATGRCPSPAGPVSSASEAAGPAPPTPSSKPCEIRSYWILTRPTGWRTFSCARPCHLMTHPLHTAVPSSRWRGSRTRSGFPVSSGGGIRLAKRSF